MAKTFACNTPDGVQVINADHIIRAYEYNNAKHWVALVLTEITHYSPPTSQQIIPISQIVTTLFTMDEFLTVLNNPTPGDTALPSELE